LVVKKEFVFTKGRYLIEVNYNIVNNSDVEFKGYLNTQLLRSSPTEDKSSVFHVGSYTGASYSNPGVHRFQKVSFSDMTKTNLDADAKGGWIAMQQHYFLSAWIPDSTSDNKFYTRALNNDYTIGAVSQALTIKPSEQKLIGSKLYIGPEITSELKEIAPALDLTVDYGILWFLSSFLFLLMKGIYNFVGNWGWSIVLVTVFIKLAFYRLSATSYKSMAGMRKLQPKLQALRERYGDDKAKISQATMELYKQEKVNPLGGCLPIVIQIPVFIALYWVLLESVELRQAPFIFWIRDLASADPYHVLPLIMGGTMFIQQKLNPAPPDPMQAKVMMALPILFTGLFWNFPSGLVLYWIVNNTLSIVQQWYITRKFSDEKTVKKITAPAK
jgi:YidC/Oxa1 family membrane protein insertase